MDFTTNLFKKSVLAGDTLIGGWSLSGSVTVAEAMGTMSYDYVVLDIEHSPAGIEDVTDLLRAVDCTGNSAVVRMASHDVIEIKKAMDRGVKSFLFPYVESVDEAKTIVSACKYPPLGNRGFAFMTRGSMYTSQTDYLSRINDEVFVGIQLETPHALSIATDIGALDGVDSVFIGPGDLSVAMGQPGQITHPDVRGAMEECVRQLNKNNIPVGTVSPSVEYTEWAVNTGFNYVSVANDLALIVKDGQAKVDAVRKTLNLPKVKTNRFD